MRRRNKSAEKNRRLLSRGEGELRGKETKEEKEKQCDEMRHCVCVCVYVVCSLCVCLMCVAGVCVFMVCVFMVCVVCVCVYGVCVCVCGV